MLNTKMTKWDWFVEILLWLIGALICIVVLYPILNMVAISLSSTGPVLRGEVGLIPTGFTTEAYETVFMNEKIQRATLNSIGWAATQCIFTCFFTFLAAYPLACCTFPGKRIWTKILLLPMWFSAGLIPGYMNFADLGMLDSYWPLILGGCVAGYNVIVAKNFITGLPQSLVESARIDGASEFSIMLRIVLPLCKPVLATFCVWTIAGTWNSYMSPLLYLTSPEKFTLQQVMRAIVLAADMSAYDISVGEGLSNMADQIRYAVLLVSMLPMITAYPFFHKHFGKGITLGAVKG